MRVVQRLGGMLSAAFLLAASNSALACHQTGHAERCVTGYSPSSVSSDAAATVDIVGRRFGSDLHRTGWQVMYGTGTAALGRATVRSWAPATIQVQLPTGLAAGSYWLALYNVDGQLRSNQLAGLTVRSFTLSPAQPGIVAPAPGPFSPQFFDVAVTLTRLVTRESGDSASDGDWIVNFAAHPRVNSLHTGLGGRATPGRKTSVTGVLSVQSGPSGCVSGPTRTSRVSCTSSIAMQTSSSCTSSRSYSPTAMARSCMIWSPAPPTRPVLDSA
jgi:hypothetical protein